MSIIIQIKKLAFDLRISYKLDFVPRDDGWFKALKDKEQEIIRKLIEIPEEDYYNKEQYSFGNWAVALLHYINDLIPFEGDRLEMRDWFEKARDDGIINEHEKSKLIRFCIDSLYF